MSAHFLKLVALGTSLIDTPFWTNELQTQLAKCVGAEVGVQRIAKSGATSRWGLEQKEQVVLAKPDVLLIEFAANDANVQRFVSVSESERNHAEIIRTVHQAKPDVQIYLLALNPTWGLRGLWIRPRLNSYYEIYHALAKPLGIGFIDVRPKWDRAAIQSTVPDGLHPTTQAMEEIAAPYIAEVVCGGLKR